MYTAIAEELVYLNNGGWESTFRNIGQHHPRIVRVPIASSDSVDVLEHDRFICKHEVMPSILDWIE